MNNSIESVDLTRLLPPSLKQDPKMIALSNIIAGELQKTNKMIRQNLIYARIDELDEQTLDVLAYDLHVDWYEYGYSIEAKRAVIKDSVRVHKRMGTLYAVRTALGSVYPDSEVEEWFDYNGEPYTFRVVLDVTHARAPAEYFSIKKAVDSYKRLSAQMENLIYQCRIGIHIQTETETFMHRVGYAGRRTAGTYPQRNIIAGISGGTIQVQQTGEKFKFKSAHAGTKPQRSTVAALRESTLHASGEGVRFSFRATATGKSNAGTEPHRSTAAVITPAEVEAYTTADGYSFKSKPTGTEPHRSTAAITAPAEVEAYTAADGYSFKSKPAGAEPDRSTTAEGENGGLVPTVTGESFAYRAKRCGTSFCKE